MQRLLNLLGMSVLVTSSATATISTISFDNQNINNHIQTQEYENGFNTKTNQNIRFNENRQFTHSEFKPTGYFLKAGFTYLINFNKTDVSTELVVGQWGKYQDLNQNGDTFSRYQITNETKWFVTKNSGMLYIADNNQSNLEIINITSSESNAVIKVPTFTVNQTNQTEFINTVKTTNSPFVEFKSKHYFATMQTKMILNEVLPNLQHSFNETLLQWDNVWNWTNEIYGLTEHSGINKKTTQYIHIANADSDTGIANATNGRIMFHNSAGAGKNLFIKPLDNQWTLWHESGHTYQTPQYIWHELTEVTVNISALYIQEKMNLPLNVFKTEVRQWISNYFSQPNRDFNSFKGNEALWTKLAMFWQLHMGFGKNFYPLLNQKYREINQNPDSVNNFINSDLKVQQFIKITSEVTGYNLSPFFKHWGLKPTWETEQETNKYKVLTAPIWNNILNSDTEKNPIVQENLEYKEISDLSEITTKNNILNFSEDFKNIEKYFNIPSSINPNDLEITSNFEPFKYKGQYYVTLKLKLSEPNKRPNTETFLIKANLNNTIMFEQNRIQKYSGMFGLDTQSNKIRFYGTSGIMQNTPPAHLIYKIQIRSNYGVLIKEIDMYHTDRFNEIITKYQLKNGLPYSNGYQITITDYWFNATKYTSCSIFNGNNYQEINNSTTTFIIQNNNLIKIS